MSRQETLRTFIAVELSAGVRSKAAAVIAKLRQSPARVSWVPAEHLHLTLKFLGDVPMVEIPRVCDTVAAAAAEIPPFTIDAEGLGAFPHEGRPRTLWLGVGRGATELITLHDYLEQRLAELGFRIEHRRFRPHITLGRVRQSGPGLDDLASRLDDFRNFEAGESDVSEVVVFSSELRREGALHEPVSFAPLIGA